MLSLCSFCGGLYLQFERNNWLNYPQFNFKLMPNNMPRWRNFWKSIFYDLSHLTMNRLLAFTLGRHWYWQWIKCSIHKKHPCLQKFIPAILVTLLWYLLIYWCLSLIIPLLVSLLVAYSLNGDLHTLSHIAYIPVPVSLYTNNYLRFPII